MGRLTTHVLDTARGCPAAGLNINLFRHVDDKKMVPDHLISSITNADGRSMRRCLRERSLLLGATGWRLQWRIIFGKTVINCQRCLFLKMW